MFSAFSLTYLVRQLISFYTLLVFIYVLMSWFPIGNDGLLYDVYRVLGSLCEPFIGIFRRILPMGASGGVGLDFSPLVAILVLQIVGNVIVGLLRTAGL
jgi:YggT family protein